jgi:ketosteroid isomerase-like protein
MSANKDLLVRFYEAFSKCDADTMAGCYHERVRFSDPVFPQLEGPRASGMWRMLCETATDLELSFSDVSADEQSGKAHWEAHYTFSATGRKVHNRIDASFQFEDGLIIEHTDDFDFWRWSRMALGPAGLLMGWSAPVKNKVRQQAAKKLDSFMAR